MKIKLIPFIYGTVILGSGFALVTGITNYFLPRHIAKNISVSKNIIPVNKSGQKMDVSSILTRNIFNIEGIIPDIGQEIGTAVKCAGNPLPSLAPYDLLGILYGGTAQRSVVVLQNRNSQEILILKQGAHLPTEGFISDIEKDRVWIMTLECPAYIAFAKPTLPPSRTRGRKALQSGTSQNSYSEAGFERVGTNTNVTKQWVNDILTNKLTTVLGDALAVPHMTNGRIDGFTISHIEPMSVYDKLGLQNGDIVNAINGIPLNDAARAIQTLNALRNEGNIILQITRNGQPVSFNVNIQQ